MSVAGSAVRPLANHGAIDGRVRSPLGNRLVRLPV